MRPLRTVFSSLPGGTAGVLWRTQVSRTGSKQPPKQYGKPIGEASYRTVPAEADESEQQPGSSAAAAEIGIKICDFTKQEQGLGKIFLTMLISELFRLGYAKIVLDTNLRNKRAQHVYERLGFRRLRVNVNSWVNQLGDLQSSVDYELNRNELNCFY